MFRVGRPAQFEWKLHARCGERAWLGLARFAKLFNLHCGRRRRRRSEPIKVCNKAASKQASERPNGRTNASALSLSPGRARNSLRAGRVPLAPRPQSSKSERASERAAAAHYRAT